MEWADFKTWVFDGPKNQALAAVPSKTETKTAALAITRREPWPSVATTRAGPRRWSAQTWNDVEFASDKEVTVRMEDGRNGTFLPTRYGRPEAKAD